MLIVARQDLDVVLQPLRIELGQVSSIDLFQLKLQLQQLQQVASLISLIHMLHQLGLALPLGGIRFAVRVQGADQAAIHVPDRLAHLLFLRLTLRFPSQRPGGFLARSSPSLLGFLLTIFAAAGLSLGLIGVYGVVAYRVRQREREIGIRLALGARPSSMAKVVVTQGVRHAIAGIALGLPAAFLLSRLMRSMVFGVTTHDPLTFAALPILIVAVTSLACYIPARRAARIDPVVAIKQD